MEGIGQSFIPGTADVDLVDRAAMPPDYRVQLTTQEFAPGGPFAALAAWLETHAARFGFFRPYRGARSGVAPEPWHFSFAPSAENARRKLTPAVLRNERWLMLRRNPPLFTSGDNQLGQVRGLMLTHLKTLWT